MSTNKRVEADFVNNNINKLSQKHDDASPKGRTDVQGLIRDWVKRTAVLGDVLSDDTFPTREEAADAEGSGTSWMENPRRRATTEPSRPSTPRPSSPIPIRPRAQTNRPDWDRTVTIGKPRRECGTFMPRTPPGRALDGMHEDRSTWSDTTQVPSRSGSTSPSRVTTLCDEIFPGDDVFGIDDSAHQYPFDSPFNFV